MTAQNYDHYLELPGLRDTGYHPTRQNRLDPEVVLGWSLSLPYELGPDRIVDGPGPALEPKKGLKKLLGGGGDESRDRHMLNGSWSVTDGKGALQTALVLLNDAGEPGYRMRRPLPRSAGSSDCSSWRNRSWHCPRPLPVDTVGRDAARALRILWMAYDADYITEQDADPVVRGALDITPSGLRLLVGARRRIHRRSDTAVRGRRRELLRVRRRHGDRPAPPRVPVGDDAAALSHITAHANSGGTPGYSGGVPLKAGQIFWKEHQPHSFEVFGAKLPERASVPTASQIRPRSFST